MHKLFLLTFGLIMLMSAALSAQSTNTSADPKAELRAKISHAHDMVLLYLYLYTRDTGTERHYKAYTYWLNQRQELVKQLSGH